MVDIVAANHVIALLAIAVGVLNCFWGYRFLKLILALAGLSAGATAGWAASAVWAPGNLGVALGCALAGGILGVLLCLWLYFLGVFLLGASLGVVVATACLQAAGTHPQPVILFFAAMLCGAIAVAVQKFMIILSTAFGGAYLLIGGLLHFLVGGSEPVPVLFDRSLLGGWGTLSYLPLVLWLVVGSVGMSAQYRRRGQAVAEVREQRTQA